MSFLDRFRRPPTLTSDVQGRTSPSGRGHYDGYIREDEHSPDLQGTRGLTFLEEMWRQDGDVRKALLMIVYAIAGGAWRIDPYGSEKDPTTAEDEEVADFVQWALWERMNPDFDAHLLEALRVVGRAGHAPFEQTFAVDSWNGRPVLVLDSLGLRLPRTIERFMQDGERLTAIEQWPDNGSPITIEALDLAYYRLGAEGDNWRGESLLRGAYKHWYYKDKLELVDAMGHERFALGIPTGYPAAGSSDADLDAFEEALKNIRANEQGYLLMPGPRADHVKDGTGGWFWEIVTPNSSGTGGINALQDSLKYHRSGIAASVIEEFMRLGQDGVGARATGDVQQDPFLASCEAIAGVVQGVWNTQVIPRLVALNFSTDRLPKLDCSLIDSTTLAELGTFVSDLSNAGLITYDAGTEAHMRERAGMPALDPEALRKREEMADAAAEALTAPKDDDDEDEKPPKKLSQSREPRLWERLILLDEIDAALDGARDTLVTAAMPHIVRIAAQAASGKAPRTDPELTAAIFTELQGLYAKGRETVRRELDAQRVGVDPMHVLSDDLGDAGEAAQMEERARLAALAALHAVEEAAANARVRGLLAADVQLAGEAAGRGAMRTAAIRNAAPALGAGRADQAAAQSSEIRGSRYTSILDRRRCSNCAAADDDVLRPLSDPVRLQRVPPLATCEGGDACRCAEVFELVDEAAPYV